MRYELKHDKLAAQIYNLASTEAKARRKAENIYFMYDEIGATRLFTEEELEYLAQFQPVLRPKDSLLSLIEESKKELSRAQREEEEKERERLDREKELVRKVKIRQQRISWVIGTAGVIAAGLLAFALMQSQKATDNKRLAAEIRQNLERKSVLTEDLKKEFSGIISEKRQREPGAATAYISELNEKLSSILIDVRDGRLYETVELNRQNWMAENLNYSSPEGSWWYDDNPENGEKYGRLYTWEAARKACPPGWRLPTDLDWRRMAEPFGGVDVDFNDGGAKAYEALIENGESNFGALLGGIRLITGTFRRLGENGQYWSNKEDSTVSGDKALLFNFDGTARRLQRYAYSKNLGASCRCVKE
ncbi:MAG: hypothetical protein H6557_22020 [Lewinellaceae bacterium]|nr:hypothetical protein [Phaeodactylibacter sp.]MCB9039300.1 hypothetical protein [Lewinellaceae bacterium]